MLKFFERVPLRELEVVMEPIYRSWDKWECYRAGFYNTKPPNGLSKTDCQEKYKEFLADLDWFAKGMEKVLKRWPNSCEQFLSNTSRNRIAWMGQSACCIELGIPSIFRGGYQLLTAEQQKAADQLAQKYIEIWEDAYVKKEHRELFKEVVTKGYFRETIERTQEEIPAMWKGSL